MLTGAMRCGRRDGEAVRAAGRVPGDRAGEAMRRNRRRSPAHRARRSTPVHVLLQLMRVGPDPTLRESGFIV
jgi:hypothetical protein